jgi:hypothetical protein
MGGVLDAWRVHARSALIPAVRCAPIILAPT